MSQRETHPFQEQQGEPEFQSEIESLDVFPHPTAELDVDQDRLQLAIEAAIVPAHSQRLTCVYLTILFYLTTESMWR